MKKQFRKIIQFISAFLLNSDLSALFNSIFSRKAGVSKTVLKNVCVPGLNCYSCPSAVGSCPIGSLQFFLNDVAMKLQLGEKINAVGLYIFGFLSGTGIIAGRLYCGWVCPFGLLQELINKITGRNRKIPAIFTQTRFLVLMLFVFILPLAVYNILYLSPWFCKLICPSGTLFAGVPLLLIDKSLRATASLITVLKFSLLILILVMLLFSNRIFCKTLCPLGALWGLFNKISIFNINYVKTDCTQCGACSNTCPMNLDVTEEYRSTKCIRCLQCTTNCPSGSLKFGFYKKENIK